MEAVLLDPSLMSQCMEFYSSLSRFLLMVVMPPSARSAYRLPLPDVVPMVWSALPDYFVEDIAEFLLFCLQ
jgi:ubiquitin conjugation factor E4 B